jgi:hypothetical protein
VKSLVAFPQILEPMNDKLDWTQRLGDAFLAQQKEVLDGVQRLRAKAQQNGNLKSTEQQKVTVEPAATGSTQQTIIIEPANPQVVYVPAYNPKHGLRLLGLSGVSAVLLAALSGLLPRLRLRRRYRLRVWLGRGGRDLRQLQLGRRRRQH